MPLRLKLELDVVLDTDMQARVIESARQLCMRDARVTTLNPQGEHDVVPAEEVIGGPEDALMELVERNPLLAESFARARSPQRCTLGPDPHSHLYRHHSDSQSEFPPAGRELPLRFWRTGVLRN